jgi:FkbM family methyltransferase
MRSDFETLLQEFYEALLRPGDVCIDVGAHVGRHAAPMARCVGAKGEVHAFEPIPDCVAALGTVEHDSPARFVIYPVALSDYTGQSDFILTANAPEWSGLKERMYDGPVDKRHLTVEVHRLDEYGVNLPRLAYIKIDAEGGECGILRGALETLRKFQPTVSFEFGMNAAGGYGVVPTDVFDIFAQVGYGIVDIRGNRLDRAAFDASGRVQSVWDYVAAPLARLEWAARVLAAHAAA